MKVVPLRKTDNFIEDYLDHYSETEVPTIFHRWCAIAGIGAILGRNCWVQFGENQIYPNQYIMLVGDSGARKGSAIKAIKSCLVGAGYKTISADKSSKEKFIEDLEGRDEDKDRLDVTQNKRNPTIKELFGEKISTEPAECFIAHDEFNAFLGHSNIDFISLLTNLWDYEGIYENRIKNGRSVKINNPTISILSGNTNIGISMAFPTETIGQGFFSRLVMVYSDPSGRRITFPRPTGADIKIQLIHRLARIRQVARGEFPLEPSATEALDEIYQNWRDLEDVRFKSYSNRRFTHLLKLCIITAAASEQSRIDSGTVRYANSILHYTEYFMPKALGEFGKARNSDVSAQVLELLDKAEKPLHPERDIWKQVSRNLDNIKQLGDIMNGLRAAGKLQVTPLGVLALKTPPKFDFPHCDISLLREFRTSGLFDSLQ